MAAHDVTASRVFFHIGEPKTGTTFLQQVMWSNRAELASQGVVLPGHHAQDHFRASQDLRGIQKLASDPAGSWAGEWDILAQQARQADKTAVISHELFSAADAEQAERAVASLQPAEVHVVITVRDMASLLPAEWQETVKHRNTRGWEDWLADVIDTESVAEDRRRFWFWRVHDTLAIGRLWSQYVPPERIHMITMAPRGKGTSLLWQRFATLIGADPGSADLTRARPNASLGLAEIETLRRLNEALPAEVPDWFYMWNVKEAVAHRALAARPAGDRLLLPADRGAWAKEQAGTLIAGLLTSGYDLIGDLDELRPRQVTGPAVSPSGQPAAQMLDAAVQAAAALVVNQYHREYPGKPQKQDGRAGMGAARGRARSGGGRGARGREEQSAGAGRTERGGGKIGALAGRVESAVGASPRVKRAVRELSSRSPAVRRLRVTAWRVLERSRTHGQPATEQPAEGQPAGGQPGAGQAAAGQPNAGQPVKGQPVKGQPGGGQS